MTTMRATRRRARIDAVAVLGGALAAALVAGCSGSMAPVSSDAAGGWALETIDGHALPHAYADTNGPVVSSGVVLADTLVLLEDESGERLTWLDDGGGPYRLRTPLLWLQPGGASGDSVDPKCADVPAVPTRKHRLVYARRGRRLVADPPTRAIMDIVARQWDRSRVGCLVNGSCR